MPDRAYCPDAGEIIWLRFDPQAGREQAGRRPALVLTPHKYNQLTRLCVVCPITSQVKGWAFEVALGEGPRTGGVVLVDHVKSLSWEQRDAAFIEQAPAEAIAKVKGLLKALMALP